MFIQCFRLSSAILLNFELSFSKLFAKNYQDILVNLKKKLLIDLLIHLKKCNTLVLQS